MILKRRGALKFFLGAALASVVGLWAAIVVRFLRPNVVNQPRGVFRAGVPADYASDSVETRYRPAHGVWVVRAGDGGRSRIYALRASCTHLGCITIWHESTKQFRCPCHGSAFSIEGLNVEGPAPRPLERCAIRIAADGRLEIDPNRTFQHQLGEWDDPESYLEV